MAKEYNKRIKKCEGRDRFWTGFGLIVVGCVLILQKMGVALPYWLFTWQSLLIFIGLVIGLRHGFRNPSWLIMVGIGAFFLMDDVVPDFSMKRFFWPVMIIGLGLLFILRPRKKINFVQNDDWHDESPVIHQFEQTSSSEKTADSKTSNDKGSDFGSYRTSTSANDFIESVSIFGGVKKVVTSKNFQGGDVICFMGGAEVNLSQAEINGTVVVELFQAFGATKLVVPPHWEVRSEAVAIFAGVEDKRHVQPGHFDPTKVLVVKGTTIFGGIEIKSY